MHCKAIREQISDNSPTITRSSGCTWWSSKQSVETLWNWSPVFWAKSPKHSTHFWAWHSMSQLHTVMSLGFFSSSWTPVFVLISFESDVCLSIKFWYWLVLPAEFILDVPDQGMILGHPNRLVFAIVPTSSTYSEFSYHLYVVNKPKAQAPSSGDFLPSFFNQSFSIRTLP